MDIDPDTLLYIQVVRPYDPAAGRYLTAGSMAAGTYNIYAFANNTPVDRSVRDVRGAGMQGIVGGSPIGAGISALVDGVVDGVVDSIWSTINSFKDGAIAAGEHIRDSWYELSDDNWDAFHSRQSDFFRSWVSHSTFQQLLEPLWLNQKHGPVTTFATHPSWVESERAAFKTYFETSNRTTSWGYGERFAPLGDEIIVTVVSSVTGRLIPPGAATLARSSRFLIKHLDDVIDVGVDGGRVIARGSNAPSSGARSANSLLKRVTGIGRLRVRGKASVFMAMLLKVVGWNILQASRSRALMRALMGLFSSLTRYCMRCAMHRRSSKTLRRRSVLTAPI